MLTTILTLLGGGLGGFLRFIPEIMKLFTEAKDRAHELEMTKLQLEIDKARAGQQIDLVHAQGDVAASAGELQAYIEALKGQSENSGVPWVDALNKSVRPVLLYWWLILFTIAKIITISMAVSHYVSMESLLANVWTEQDAGIFSMMIGFWYVNRTLHNAK